MCMSAKNSLRLSGAPKRSPSPLATKLCGIALLGVLGSCAVGPNFHRPNAPPVTHYANGADPSETATVDGSAQKFSPGAQLAADWWLLFGSSNLDEGMATATAS